MGTTFSLPNVNTGFSKYGVLTPDSLVALFTAGFSLGGLFQEFSQDNVTAAGSTQATAFPCLAQTIRITSCAAGAGISLPPAASGLEILVINHGANSCQVYGSGTDKIDDVASSTGVVQMPSSMVIYSCATNGNWYSNGLSTGFSTSLGLQTVAYADGLTAAGNSQGTALVLPSRLIYNVTTVGASTGVLLPASANGLVLTVANNGANALSIYPNGNDKINSGIAGAAFVTGAPPNITLLYCFTAGQWYTK